MPSEEAKLYADSIIGKVDRIVDCLDGLSTDEINSRPPVDETSTLLILAVHTMANVEENVAEIILGQPVNRDRDSEFASQGSSADEVRQKWDDLRTRIRPMIEGLSDDQLGATYTHQRRGEITGRGVLLLAATHAAEHVGHAELTRDWIKSMR